MTPAALILLLHLLIVKVRIEILNFGNLTVEIK